MRFRVRSIFFSSGGDRFATQGRHAAVQAAFQIREIALDHHSNEVFKGYGWFPAEYAAGLRSVGHEIVHLGGPEVAGIDFDVLAPVEVRRLEGEVSKFPDGVGMAGTDDIVIRCILLEHEPHGADIVWGVAPIAASVQVAKVKLIDNAVFDSGDGPGNLARYEGLAAARRLMVEENAAGSVETVALPVIDRKGVGEELGAGIRTAGVEDGALGLGRRGRAEHFARGCLVEAAAQTGAVDGLQQAKRAHADRIAGILGDLEADLDVTLGAEVVDLVGPDVI